MALSNLENNKPSMTGGGGVFLLDKTKSSIEVLQNELSHAKRENENLKRSQEAKALQLKELKSQLDMQHQRLSGLDGKLSRDQGALAAACAAAQNKDAELAKLKHLNQSQTEAISRLEKRVAEAEAAVASLHAKEVSLEGCVHDLESQRMAKDSALEQFNIKLQEESRLFKAAEQQHADEIHRMTRKLAETEDEWKRRVEQARNEGAKALAQAEAVQRAGAASAHEWSDQITQERLSWEGERARILHECQQRLENAETLLDQAAKDSIAYRQHAAQDAAEQMRRMENTWNKRLEDAVHHAREEERRRLNQNASLESAQYHKKYIALEQHMQERMDSMRASLAADISSLQHHFENCLNALTDRVIRSQAVVERRQGCILKHLNNIARCTDDHFASVTFD